MVWLGCVFFLTMLQREHIILCFCNGWKNPELEWLMYGMAMMCSFWQYCKESALVCVFVMSEKAHSLKGVLYGMTRMCLSDNTVKNVCSSVFVMSGKKTRTWMACCTVWQWCVFFQTILTLTLSDETVNWDSLCVYHCMHAKNTTYCDTQVKDPVVHVRVQGITEIPK